MGIYKKQQETIFLILRPMSPFPLLRRKKFFGRLLSGKKFLFFVWSYVVSIYINPSLPLSLSFISTVAPKPNRGVCLIPQYLKFTQLPTSDWPDRACVYECVYGYACFLSSARAKLSLLFLNQILLEDCQCLHWNLGAAT